MSVYEYMNFKRIIPSKYYNARCFTCSLIDLPVLHWQIKWFYMYMLCTSYKLLSSFLIFGDVYIVNAPQNLTPFCIHWDTSIFVITVLIFTEWIQCAGNALEFDVDNKIGFEVPLSHVSHTTTAKQEVTLEFHPNDDAAVSLMELRFHIPPDPKDTEKDLVQVGCWSRGLSL